MTDSSKIKEEINQSIRVIPDFPIKGIQFKDITTLLSNSSQFQTTISLWKKEILESFGRPTQLVALESRGFIFAAPLANELNCGLTLIRKKGKLPYKTFHKGYGLEYGEDIVEIHQDAFKPEDRILIIDDVLATGGTAEAAKLLCQENFSQTEILGFSFLMDIPALEGTKKLTPYRSHTLL